MLEPFGRAPLQALIAAVRTGSRHHASYAGGREAGGASRDRTGDLLVANQTLSQLSYGPVLDWPKSSATILADITRRAPAKRVGFAGCVCACPGGSGRSCTSDLTLIRGAL